MTLNRDKLIGKDAYSLIAPHVYLGVIEAVSPDGQWVQINDGKDRGWSCLENLRFKKEE
jgi:hypothetical protein